MAQPGDANSTIYALNPQVLSHIFSYLDFKDCAAVACVQHTWRSLADDDQLWRRLCKEDYHVTTLEDLSGSRSWSFKGVYKSWYLGFGKNRYGAFLLRAKKCWDSITEWMQRHAPDIAATIAPGASEDELDQLEKKLDRSLPLAVRAIYRLHNGQIDESLLESDDPERLKALFHGLFGGYNFYEHIVCTRLLQAHEIVPFRKRAGNNPFLAAFARSFNHQKHFAVCLLDGQVYANTRTGQHVCCCPPDSQTGGLKAGSVRQAVTPERLAKGDPSGDGMLRWMEEYARRLQEGWYAVKNLWDDDITRGVCLYPEAGPALAEAVTRGVKVRSSSVFVPEHSLVSASTPSSNQYFFSYSIRISYSLGEAGAYPSLPPSVQLHSRRWLIRQDEELVDEVRGEGVIGKYPVLKPGQPEFVYQSCSSSTAEKGSMEGSLQFVPGSLVRPTGPEFDVKVERFALEIPDYIY